MKKLALFMSFVIILTASFSYGRIDSEQEILIPSALNAPTFQKLDPEIIKVARDHSIKLEQIENKQFRGSAYIKPKSDTGMVENLDVTGKEQKGIAILVDFKYDGDHVSDVPGVDYERIPAYQFYNLLNGTYYNPYELDVFKDLATIKLLDKEDNLIKTYEAPTDRTLRNYYTEVSYGGFEIDVEVVDWVTLDHPYSYYLSQENGYYNENGDAHIGQLVYDALTKADANIDFSEYAIDIDPNELWYYEEDGTPYTLETKDSAGNYLPVKKIVPNIFIIHRGTGAEYSTDPNIIWSHQWDVMSAKYFGYYYQNGTFMNEKDLKYPTFDGVAVNTYNICPEVGRDISGYLINLYDETKLGPNYTGSKPSPAYPGVYAHEFGHVLGLPDFYDYGYDSEGLGMYTLMAGGSYGRNIPSGFYSGNTPVHLDAWSKMYLGFLDPKVISKADGVRQTITLRPSNSTKDVYKIYVPDSFGREYFLLENRQQDGFDKGLITTVNGKDTHGLAIYHVVNDILYRNFGRPNEAANWDNNHTGIARFKDSATGEHHYAVSLIQADGNYDLEKNINDGDSGDLFPGIKNTTTLLSKANTKINTSSLYSWTKGKNETGIIIENIIEENGIITCDVVFTK